MAVKIKRRIFVEDNDYFVNEKGRKYTRLGFDDIKKVGLSSFAYRLGKKFNIVSGVFVQMHKHKDDYIQPAIYDEIIEFPTFYLLFKKDNLEGVKLVEKNDKSTIFSTGRLVYCEKDKFAIVVNDQSTIAIYSTDDTTELYKMPNFSTTFESVERKGKEIYSSAQLFNFAGNFIKSAEQICNDTEFKQITEFFRVILNDDVLNYAQTSKKYLLVDKASNLVLNDLNRDINEFKIVLKEANFDSQTQAQVNAQNVLNYYRTKMALDLQNKAKLNKNPAKILNESVSTIY